MTTIADLVDAKAREMGVPASNSGSAKSGHMLKSTLERLGERGGLCLSVSTVTVDGTPMDVTHVGDRSVIVVDTEGRKHLVGFGRATVLPDHVSWRSRSRMRWNGPTKGPA